MSISKIKKGDDIKVSCNYSSLNRGYVKGGVTALDEMCQVFLMYYPRNPTMVRCKEVFELNTWQEFLIGLNKYYFSRSRYFNFIHRRGPIFKRQKKVLGMGGDLTYQCFSAFRPYSTMK